MTGSALTTDQRVDVGKIEKALADLWRTENENGEHAVTRAALWNVVAHTSSSEHHARASETLGRASAAVPQRSIVVRSIPSGEAEMASWISANCHRIGGDKQVCSEEIAIVAGGDRIHRVPPLVRALLLPDMPVAVWWLGDLPNEHEDYVQSLLEPADRLIVDSLQFDSPADLSLIARVSEQTTTTPADLNWVRLEEWRTATASIFDPPEMRSRLATVGRVRVVAATGESDFFGHSVESLLFSSWISAQLGHHVDREGKVEGPSGAVDYRFERRRQSRDVGGISLIELVFEDGSVATITRDRELCVLTTNVDGIVSTPDGVTRSLAHHTPELIVRQLKRPEGDRILAKVLPVAARMARRIG
jgi:glucose-6-phosphate dehydrogenase assembly protein OpcA